MKCFAVFLVTWLNTNDPPSIVVLEFFLEIEKAPRETVQVCERNKQNINLIWNPKERARGLISQGVHLGRERKRAYGINEVGLALEWKSGYQLSVKLYYSSLFTTYVHDE